MVILVLWFVLFCFAILFVYDGVVCAMEDLKALSTCLALLALTLWFANAIHV